MLRIPGSRRALCDGLSRRDFLHVGALGLAGMSLASPLAEAGRKPPAGFGKGRSVILLFLYGGASPGRIPLCEGISMRNRPRRLKLSPDEETFLRHWMRDEAHFLEGHGFAKRCQVEHHVRPADLALLAAAAFPDLQEQAAIAEGPPFSDVPLWPWDEQAFGARLREARMYLGLPAEDEAGAFRC